MRDFDARLTLLNSAQTFHWREIGGRFAACVDGRLMTDADTDARARRYFDDDRDYAHLADACGACPAAAKALSMLPGLRVVNQPAWEALVAFILSANNNVARIRRLVGDLCLLYGPKVEYEGHTLCGFPPPEALARADAAELREKVRCGYRAEYLIGSARRVLDGFSLSALQKLPVDEARAKLVTLPGVGEKVADCVLLFGCGHADAFPVDVWVSRLMADWFHVTGSRAQVRVRARALLGENCGLIQQALFHAARTELIDVSKGNAS